ncbi:hypothetical protein AN958_02991, partial [Leucoagaricus sp. SymC.cos]
GDQENITVIMTICANGTSIPPAVIFRGEAYHVQWKQNNPLNATCLINYSLGHSKKGYTDGKIGVLWLKFFNQHMQTKANGHRQLLLVDEHNSHYTHEFLEFMQENHIHVLCYPSHSTHIYQELDVVIFSILKKRWTEERDQYK